MNTKLHEALIPASKFYHPDWCPFVIILEERDLTTNVHESTRIDVQREDF
jgi:hypothetical protein